MTNPYPPRPIAVRRFVSPIARGFSLIEIMVSLAIGLVVIGAVFANYLNNSAGSRQASAMAQVTQDASLAMGILRNHIAMAGYSRPIGISGSTMTHAVGLKAIVGCSEGFDSSTEDNPDYSKITCNPASPAGTTPQSDSIAVTYEADTDSMTTVTTKGSPTPVPTDCTGIGLKIAGSGTNTFYVADNRFAIQQAVPAKGTPPALICKGNGNIDWGNSLTNGPRPLVENIVGMTFSYGIGDAPSATDTGKNVTQYMTASQIATSLAGDWTRVLSVRICLLVQSEGNVLDKPTPYYDCNGNAVKPSDPNDRHIYRAFKSTVVLNNNIAS